MGFQCKEGNRWHILSYWNWTVTFSWIIGVVYSGGFSSETWSILVLRHRGQEKQLSVVELSVPKLFSLSSPYQVAESLTLLSFSASHFSGCPKKLHEGTDGQWSSGSSSTDVTDTLHFMGLADLISEISTRLWNTWKKHYRLFFLV